MNKIIYVLINEAMPGYVKIGQTTNLAKRMRDLYATGVPLPFECFYACTVKDADHVEKQLLDAFSDHRVPTNREFFELSPARIVAALKLVEIKNVTQEYNSVDSPEEQQALTKARTRRANFNFKAANIPIGAELSYVNDKSIKAKVIDNKSIELNEEIMTLSASAQKLLGYSYQINGTLYWMFGDETLDERRRRVESEE